MAEAVVNAVSGAVAVDVNVTVASDAKAKKVARDAMHGKVAKIATAGSNPRSRANLAIRVSRVKPENRVKAANRGADGVASAVRAIGCRAKALIGHPSRTR